MMNRLILFRTLFFAFILIFSSCQDPVKLDTAKLDTFYFTGEYQTSYLGKVEKIFLKEDGLYDYVYGKNNDTTIQNAGKWSYESNKSCYVSLTNYPNIRTVKIFTDDGDRVNLSLDVNTHIEENLGDLEMLVIDHKGGELNYTFIKQDKSRNKNYIKK